MNLTGAELRGARVRVQPDGPAGALITKIDPTIPKTSLNQFPFSPGASGEGPSEAHGNDEGKPEFLRVLIREEKYDFFSILHHAHNFGVMVPMDLWRACRGEPSEPSTGLTPLFPGEESGQK